MQTPSKTNSGKDLSSLELESQRPQKTLQEAYEEDSKYHLEFLDNERKRKISTEKQALVTMKAERDSMVYDFNKQLADRTLDIKVLSENHKGQIIAKNIEITELKVVNNIYKDAGQDLGDLLLVFGDHKTECNIWELKTAGRLVDIAEEEMCTCKWSETIKMIEQAKDNGSSGQTSKKDVQMLLGHYKGL